MSNDLDVDDLFPDPEKKKKIKSGAKGKGAEREIVKILNERFAKILKEHPAWGQFSRSVGSGNRWGQKVVLSESAKQIYSGDLTCPECFRFVVESKKGYNDIDLCSAFSGSCKGLDDFLTQVSDDAKRTGRKPLLIWKKDRKPALAFLKEDLKGTNLIKPVCMFYLDWTVIQLENLLPLPDEFWFAI